MCFSLDGICKAVNDNQPLITYDVSGSEGWAPYYMRTRHGDEYGILPELMKLIFKRANMRAKSVNYPPKRTNAYIQQGILDIDLVNPEWIPDVEIRDSFIYSDGLFEIKEFYMTNKGFDPASQFTEDEKPRVGMIRGYYYHNQDEYTRLDFPTEKALLEALKKSRVNIIICGDLPAQYWGKKLKAIPEYYKLHSQGLIKLRMRKELSYLLPEINDVIHQLKQEGQIEKLMKKYQ